MQVIPVILCGGSGSRLWPVSRAKHPKQLLAIAGENTMLQETMLRLRGLSMELAEPLLVCNETHRHLAAQQLRDLGMNPRVVLEPEGRNTAPAVALAAHVAKAADDSLLLVLPADHVVRDSTALASAIEQAIPAASAGRLLTFGVVPTAAETGYGYIRARQADGPVGDVECFVEKPDAETAQAYIASGDYYWNSGMFLFSASQYLTELARYAPEISTAVDEAMAVATEDGQIIRPGVSEFLASPKDSIDYAVMEKTERASLVPLDAGWSDVGSWAAVHAVSEHDQYDNVLYGDVVLEDCEETMIRADHRLVAAVGLRDCVVIETKDAVLVAPKDRSQDVKRIVDQLSASKRDEVQLGREVFRPWGSYDSLESMPGFQVKRLIVLPGAILSLQLHHQRSEHWVVVSGIARITRDDDVYELKRNEHTFIPVGAKHRIENPGTELLQIIEVQIGDYLGEDDIVRFEDKYGREGSTD